MERRIKRVSSNDSLNPKINDLGKIRRKGTRFRRTDYADAYKTPEGEPGIIRQIITHYHEVNDALKAYKDGNFSNILPPKKLNQLHSEFSRMYQNLEAQHKACMQADNAIETKHRQEKYPKLGLEKNTQKFAYDTLMSTIIDSYHSMKRWKTRIVGALSTLVPQEEFRKSSPKISSSNMINDTKRFIIENIQTISLNGELTDQYKSNIIHGIGQSNDKTVSQVLVPLLSDRQINWRVGRTIANAIGTLGDQTVSQDLVPLLSDTQINWGIREDIANAIGTLGDQTVSQDLVPLLSDTQIDWSVRRAIIDTIGTLGDQTVSRNLVPLLSNEQIVWQARCHIADTIGTLGDQTLIPLLSNRQIEWQVGCHIADTIGTLGDKTVSQDLVPLLSDTRIDRRVRCHIADTIRRLGDKAVVPDLISLLSNTQIEWQVGIRIVDAIGSLGNKEVIPELVPFLSNTQIDWGVRQKIKDTIRILEFANRKTD